MGVAFVGIAFDFIWGALLGNKEVGDYARKILEDCGDLLYACVALLVALFLWKGSALV
ncbi:hypothetical protein [Bartonella machadoae]|uniref:hypothetical protein n=1 Tax=Bartonella machadoae TaxID=2893471 RepID=UPI001F4D02EC|nr:hypothetical protein [Bartonella machadoae]UNE53927.1 hypothetical protein LNM86_10135 [Bartonella machadoae]